MCDISNPIFHDEDKARELFGKLDQAKKRQFRQRRIRLENAGGRQRQSRRGGFFTQQAGAIGPR